MSTTRVLAYLSTFIVDSTAAGRAMLTAASAAAQRTLLGLGTSAVIDVGTTANNVVQLTAAAKLPAVDGSLLTGIPTTGSGTELQCRNGASLAAVTGSSVSGGSVSLGSSSSIGWTNRSSINSPISGIITFYAADGINGADLYANTVFALANMNCNRLVLGTYTVATLPNASSNTYMETNVTDALAPTMGSTVVAGGSVKTRVRSNGTNWTVCGI